MIAGLVLQSLADRIEGLYLDVERLVPVAFEEGDGELARTLEGTREQLGKTLNFVVGYEVA